MRGQGTQSFLRKRDLTLSTAPGVRPLQLQLEGQGGVGQGRYRPWPEWLGLSWLFTTRAGGAQPGAGLGERRVSVRFGHSFRGQGAAAAPGTLQAQLKQSCFFGSGQLIRTQPLGQGF